MLEHIVDQTHKLLLKNDLTVAVAESCTGGLVSALLTKASGSSSYFILGVVVYSNASKNKILRISAKLIREKGAVSEQVAIKLAESVRKIAGTDFGIGITGIAGPTGASPNKPVGTVFISISTRKKTIYKKFHFTGTRTIIRNKSALEALKLLINTV
jgi:nicotinamide-nucleotide amidase